MKLFGRRGESLTDEIARSAETLAQATEPGSFERALVREALRLVPAHGVAWLTVSAEGVAVAAQAPQPILVPEKLAGSIVQRGLMTRGPARSVVRTDPAIRELPADVLLVPMSPVKRVEGLLVATRAVSDPFQPEEQRALDALVRAAATVRAVGLRAASTTVTASSLRLTLFWAQPPSSATQEHAVGEAARIVKANLRPTDRVQRVDEVTLEIALLNTLPEGPAVVSQRLHHALAGCVVQLANARWLITPVDTPSES